MDTLRLHESDPLPIATPGVPALPIERGLRLDRENNRRSRENKPPGDPLGHGLRRGRRHRGTNRRQGREDLLPKRDDLLRPTTNATFEKTTMCYSTLAPLVDPDPEAVPTIVPIPGRKFRRQFLAHLYTVNKLYSLKRTIRLFRSYSLVLISNNNTVF